MAPKLSTDVRVRTVRVRVPDDFCALIDRAAQASRMTRSDFMVEAARRVAEEALSDRTAIQIDAVTDEHFRAILDAPPAGEGFDRLMRTRPPWSP